MPTIPDPSDLLESARYTQRPIEDREWKRYQRYLRKLKQQQTNPPQKPLLSFEEFCEALENQEK